MLRIVKNATVTTTMITMTETVSPCVPLLVVGFVAFLLASEEPVGGKVGGRVGGKEGGGSVGWEEEEVGGSMGGEEEVGGSVGGEEEVDGSVGGEELGKGMDGEEVGEVTGSALRGVGAGDVPDELVLLRVGVVLTDGWLLKKATCGLSRIPCTAPRRWVGSAVV